jgi:hypothetical protein
VHVREIAQQDRTLRVRHVCHFALPFATRTKRSRTPHLNKHESHTQAHVCFNIMFMLRIPANVARLPAQQITYVGRRGQLTQKLLPRQTTSGSLPSYPLRLKRHTAAPPTMSRRANIDRAVARKKLPHNRIRLKCNGVRGSVTTIGRQYGKAPQLRSRRQSTTCRCHSLKQIYQQ